MIGGACSWYNIYWSDEMRRRELTGLPGVVTVMESYIQSPILGPSAVVQATEVEEEPHVNGWAMLNSSKSSLRRITFGLALQIVYMHWRRKQNKSFICHIGHFPVPV